LNKITSIASAALAATLLACVAGPALTDVLVPPLQGEHRQNAWEALTSPEPVSAVTKAQAKKKPHYTVDSIARPSEREWADMTVALVHDPKTNVSIVYPRTLPMCDSDDGTNVSKGKLVAACKWDGGANSFIVIAP
jgi:hypothetical protein